MRWWWPAPQCWCLRGCRSRATRCCSCARWPACNAGGDMRDDTMWKAIVLLAVTATVVGCVFVYRTQNVFDWPRTFNAANDVAQIVALMIAGGWALNRFVVTRASRTFLEMSTGAKVVSGADESLL